MIPNAFEPSSATAGPSVMIPNVSVVPASNGPIEMIVVVALICFTAESSSACVMLVFAKLVH